jgi:hypothetical protein
MPNSQSTESLVYVSEKGPDVQELAKAYERTVDELNNYFLQCTRSYEARRNIWPGKSDDLRKGGADAFPWKGASDTEAHVISERIGTYIAICQMALARANIRAYPVEAGDAAKARVTSSFLKWMISSHIPDFSSEMELGANYLFEKGLMVTYVGWEREDSKYLQSVSIEQIASQRPDLAQIILAGENDAELVVMLQQAYPGLSEARGKRALKQLRKEGVAEIPTTRRQIDRPCVKACAPDGEVVLPPYCMEPQRAPYIFYRTLMTAQEILSKVATEGWDRDWAEYVIEHLPGEGLREEKTTTARREVATARENEELYVIISGYQRLIDEEDGARGIYRTVFHPKLTAEKEGIPAYGKFELLNGFEDYPFVFTSLSRENKRLYDIVTIPEQLRGLQDQVKVERDSRSDRNGLATQPPLMHPPGKPPVGTWKPGGYISRIRQDDFTFAPAPAFNPGSVELEQTMLKAADGIMGLDAENPLSQSKRQFLVDKYLCHVRDVIKAAHKAFQRFGPEEVFFRVTGVADPMKYTKGNPDEDLDLRIAFDVQQTDPEVEDQGVKGMFEILPYDRNGRINVDALIEYAANKESPILADTILQPVEVAQQKVVKEVTDDLTKIFSGIEVGARPNGAQMAMQLVQQYASQPDIAQKLQQDTLFAMRLQKYAEQYQFQLQQAQNAEIGRIGTAPANMGGAPTQTANSQT